MVLADRGRGFVQVVAASIADLEVNALDADPRLLPVAAELRFTAHLPLRFAQANLMSLEAA